jgi:glycosyltransferase involved in cell wall biosynthesis
VNGAVPTVTVVVVFYDDQRFLAQAIDSVFRQTFPAWELLLVDDGSTDGSTEIARRVAAANPGRVRYLDHPDHTNRGISATRNRGIADARGRYVAFLDSDDVWLPEKLGEQVALLEAHPDVGLLFGASRYWWSWAGEESLDRDRVLHPGASSDQQHEPPSLLLSLYPFGKGIAPCPSSCIARREVIEALGGFEEQFRTMYEDQAFLTKAYLTTPVWISNRCWDLYRRHPDAITLQTGEAEYHAFRRSFLRWFEACLETQGITDPRVHAALQRAWWPYLHPHLARARHHVGVARAKIRRRLRRRS